MKSREDAGEREAMRKRESKCWYEEAKNEGARERVREEREEESEREGERVREEREKGGQCRGPTVFSVSSPSPAKNFNDLGQSDAKLCNRNFSSKKGKGLFSKWILKDLILWRNVIEDNISMLY